jgi:hypothetical protein
MQHFHATCAYNMQHFHATCAWKCNRIGSTGHIGGRQGACGCWLQHRALSRSYAIKHEYDAHLDDYAHAKAKILKLETRIATIEESAKAMLDQYRTEAEKELGALRAEVRVAYPPGTYLVGGDTMPYGMPRRPSAVDCRGYQRWYGACAGDGPAQDEEAV